MANRKRHDDRIIQLITLSEEISSMSNKVKQLIEDLHGTPTVLAGVKEITNSLNGKVGNLAADLKSYAPMEPEDASDPSDPSWIDGINERERIVPTPDNVQDYMPINVKEETVNVSTENFVPPAVKPTPQSSKTKYEKKTATKRRKSGPFSKAK